MRPLILLAACLAIASAVAAEATPPGPAAEQPVALVGGKPITLRQLEDELLRKEGSDQLMEWLRQRLEGTEWTKLPDDAVILEIGGGRLTRRELALQLLRREAGKVRDELIQIEQVNQVLASEGIVVDQAASDAEWTRMERRFQRELKAKKQQQIDFASFIQAKEKQTREQFLAQPGIRMLAGLHQLVLKRARADYTDERLREVFERRRASLDQPESLELSVIFIPWQARPGPDGKPQIGPEEKARLEDVMRTLHAAIASGRQDFAAVWEAYARPYDPKTRPGGKVGPVARDGTRLDAPEARRIPAAVMDEAWRAPKTPQLLQPMSGEAGVDLVRVEARRPFKAATFEDCRARILEDEIEGELDARTSRLLGELRQGPVEFRSIPALVERRQAEKP